MQRTRQPWLHRFDRWMYRGGRPNRVARILNRIGTIHYATGIAAPRQAVTLEVVGRKTGKVIAFPLVLTRYHGERYLVAMLGERANWVHPSPTSNASHPSTPSSTSSPPQ